MVGEGRPEAAIEQTPQKVRGSRSRLFTAGPIRYGTLSISSDDEHDLPVICVTWGGSARGDARPSVPRRGSQ